MQTEQFKVTGMTCGGCTNNVTRALKGIHGVGDVKISLSAGEATLSKPTSSAATGRSIA